jgi:hypothetical protein
VRLAIHGQQPHRRTHAFFVLHFLRYNMGLSGKQPGLLVAVIVPALLSTFVVIARSMSKVKRRPSYISKTGALAAEILLVASVVCLFNRA